MRAIIFATSIIILCSIVFYFSNKSGEDTAKKIDPQASCISLDKDHGIDYCLVNHNRMICNSKQCLYYSGINQISYDFIDFTTLDPEDVK